MKVALGNLACNGIEACLGSDLAAGARAALNDLAERIDAGQPPIAIPDFLHDAPPSEPAFAVELPVDKRTWTVLEREAARQGATVAQLATHSVLLYLAELDRLTPPDGATAA